MVLAKELVGSFLMGFFSAVLVISLLLYFSSPSIMFVVSAAICVVSIILLYFVDLRVGHSAGAKRTGSKKFKYCYNCGAENLKQAKFCHNCNSKLN